MNAAGTFDYDPNGQFENLAVGETASDTFTYTIDDGRGQPNSTDTATVTVTIDGVNDGPVAQDDAVSTAESSLLAGANLLADNGSGVDWDPDTSDTYNVTQVDGAGFTAGTPFALPSGALLTVNTAGTFDYDPNGQFENLSLGQTATDTFSYTIDDGQGQPNSTDTATVTVTINGVNDGPVAAADAVTTTEDNALRRRQRPVRQRLWRRLRPRHRRYSQRNRSQRCRFRCGDTVCASVGRTADDECRWDVRLRPQRTV